MVSKGRQVLEPFCGTRLTNSRLYREMQTRKCTVNTCLTKQTREISKKSRRAGDVSAHATNTPKQGPCGADVCMIATRKSPNCGPNWNPAGATWHKYVFLDTAGAALYSPGSENCDCNITSAMLFDYCFSISFIYLEKNFFRDVLQPLHVVHGVHQK